MRNALVICNHADSVEETQQLVKFDNTNDYPCFLSSHLAMEDRK